MKTSFLLRAISHSFWGRLALHALWLHGSWEAVQCAFFYAMGDVALVPGIAIMVGATLADIALTLLLVWIALRLSVHSTRFSLLRAAPPLIGLGGGVAVFIEAVGQEAAHWWRYSAAMPAFQIFEWQIGLFPVLQMAFLPLVCLVLTSRRLRVR